jgi:hypothetical protein
MNDGSHDSTIRAADFSCQRARTTIGFCILFEWIAFNPRWCAVKKRFREWLSQPRNQESLNLKT